MLPSSVAKFNQLQFQPHPPAVGQRGSFHPSHQDSSRASSQLPTASPQFRVPSSGVRWTPSEPRNRTPRHENLIANGIIRTQPKSLKTKNRNFSNREKLRDFQIAVKLAACFPGPASIVSFSVPLYLFTPSRAEGCGKSGCEWPRGAARVRIDMRLLLLKLLLGDTSGLQDRACSLFYLAGPK